MKSKLFLATFIYCLILLLSLTNSVSAQENIEESTASATLTSTPSAPSPTPETTTPTPSPTVYLTPTIPVNPSPPETVFSNVYQPYEPPADTPSAIQSAQENDESEEGKFSFLSIPLDYFLRGNAKNYYFGSPIISNQTARFWSLLSLLSIAIGFSLIKFKFQK